ncbi:MAG: alpha/beta hydrolase [Bacteroidales bacterium]|jgi:acetyl esterase/lipase|nr:alpha/beta hydrolase [Bacteroidales bacterium]
MKNVLFFLIVILQTVLLSAQKTQVFIWKDVKQMKKEKSRLYVFSPSDTLHRDIAVIICPGGSYAHLYGIKQEGFEVARRLNSAGITAFVLKYRVGKDGYHHPAMLEDVQRAIQWVKDHADVYQIDPDKVGVMGFSAGGHLSLMAGIFYTDNQLEKTGAGKCGNLKPAFVVPVYAVVSMQDSLVHSRSRKNLLGKHIDQKTKDAFSMELQLREDMPPVFLVAAKDDPVVSCKNSTTLDAALTQKGVPHEFLLYETGGHGFGMNERQAGDAAHWDISFLNWLLKTGLCR